MSDVWSEPKPATEEIQEIADEVKEVALKKLKQQSFLEYEAAEYQTQEVAGVNFKIKVQVTPAIVIRDVFYADYIQLNVYCDLRDQYSLTDAIDLGRLP